MEVERNEGEHTTNNGGGGNKPPDDIQSRWSFRDKLMGRKVVDPQRV